MEKGSLDNRGENLCTLIIQTKVWNDHFCLRNYQLRQGQYFIRLKSLWKSGALQCIALNFEIVKFTCHFMLKKSWFIMFRNPLLYLTSDISFTDNFITVSP